MYAAYAPHSHHYDETAALALVRLLEKNDLEQLLNDDSKLNALIADLDQVKRAQIDRDTLFASNKSLAEHNLSMEPKFTDLKRQVATLYEDVNKLNLGFVKNKTQLDTFCSAQSLETTLALMQTEAAVAEEKSEKLADNFCAKGASVENFLTDFLALKTQAHIRRIKVDKMTELVKNMQNFRTTGHWATGMHTGGSAPYPTPTISPYPPPDTMPQPSYYR